MSAPDPDSRRSLTIRLPRLPRFSPRPGGATTSRVTAALASHRVRVVMAALVVLLVAGDLFVWHRADARSATVDSSTAALKSARVRVPLMLSYDYRTLDADLAVAAGNATGSFQTDYRKLLNDVVAPRAAQKKVVTTTRVVDAAVVSGNSSTVRVLAFLSQSSTAGSKKAELSGSRVVVRMVHTDKGWFVAGLKPV